MERSAPPPDREFNPTSWLSTDTTGRQRSHCRPFRGGVGEASCRAVSQARREGMDCGSRTRINTGAERGSGDCTQSFPTCRWIRGCRRGFSSRTGTRAECDRARGRYAPRSCNLHRSRWGAGPTPAHRDHGARRPHVVLPRMARARQRHHGQTDSLRSIARRGHRTAAVRLIGRLGARRRCRWIGSRRADQRRRTVRSGVDAGPVRASRRIRASRTPPAVA